MRKHFEKACSTHPKWADLTKEKQETTIRRMERDCFEKTINSCTRDGIDRLWTEKIFKDRYSAECSRILSNLDRTSPVQSTYLLDQIITGQVNEANVAGLSNFDLCPNASQAERDEINLRLQIKVEVKISKAYSCGKCGKHETTVRSFQGRSADEDNTLSIKCINCGNVWRKH